MSAQVKVIGIDGGGAHTAACLIDLASGNSFLAEAGPSNIHHAGLETACDAVEQAVRSVLREANETPGGTTEIPVDALACCLSGAGRESDRAAIRENLAARNLADRIFIANDAEAILASARVFGPAVAVVAGTGSFAWGRDESGGEARADGWGSLLGDDGGAFAIAIEALRAACRFHDGRGPRTPLLGLALEHYGLERPEELIEILATPAIPRQAVSDFAPRVFEAAHGMDPVALGIIDNASTELVKSALAVRRRLFPDDREAAFVLGGALALNQPFYQEHIAAGIHNVHPNDPVLLPRDPLALGAARVALRELGLDPNSDITNLDEELRKIRLEPPGNADAESKRVFDECAALATEQLNPQAAEMDENNTLEILQLMNREDSRVAPAIEKVLPRIADAVDRVVRVFRDGGRLFYIGAGTSGRRGALDAAECPPTFGTDPSLVQALIAGGVATLLRSKEGAEDRADDAPRDLEARGFSSRDILVGLAASSRTPYVLAGLQHAHSLGAQTILITCSPPPPSFILHPSSFILPLVGPEAVMGSTRLKAATAQKMILNMLTTTAMIRLGKVYKGMMVDLQMSCGKLTERAKRTVMTLTGIDYDRAAHALSAAGGSVKRALVMTEAQCAANQADLALESAQGQVRKAIEIAKEKKWFS